ncbi:CD276 antigen isoform X3 [Phyllopteryx taeniolatus]|uniref:CD276 antigen isoform X3 n=1 Tax=Phyllopteryx taeniolatus TaxID=161469 RepID=UPI002AD45E37|nr:CD276 antigen isoform X3 [Phyllopteryx taeniolatus]
MVLSWVAPKFLKTSILWRLLTVIFTVSLPLAPQERLPHSSEDRAPPVWSLHVLPVPACVFSGHSGFLPHPKNMHESFAQIQLRGEGQEFVNGFHTLKKIRKEKWENTSVENNSATVQMVKLKASHSGEYQCYIQYKGEPNVSNTIIHLSVTANFSKPTVITSCHANRCLLTCSSHGGYPRSELMWKVIGNSSGPMWTVLNVSEESDPNTMLYNTSSTVSFNCSYGEEMLISCSMGGVTSELLFVCVPKHRPEIVKPTICSVVLFIAMILLVLVWKFIKKQKMSCSKTNNVDVDPKELKALK